MDTDFDNCSWNCGVEGETDDPQVLALRRRQMKNIMTILMLSRGVPMFWAGDEFANTQYGNNNAFTCDSKTSWLDWNRLEEFRDVFEYVRRLIAFRKAHPVVRRDEFFDGHNSSRYPELSWHGERPWEFDRSQPFLTFAFMYSEPAQDFGTDGDSFIYCAYNSHWEDHTFELPIIPEGMSWYVVLSSADETFSRCGERVDGNVWLQSRSCVVLEATRG